MRLLLAATCLATIAVPTAPVLAQTVIGSGVAASTAANSAERPIGFAASAPTDAALVVLTADKSLPVEAPFSADERKVIEAALANAGFAAKANEALSLRGIGARPRILMMGLGKDGGSARLGFTAPFHGLITGRANEFDRRIELVVYPDLAAAAAARGSAPGGLKRLKPREARRPQRRSRS
mgnify:CR=1 FL=1